MMKSIEYSKLNYIILDKNKYGSVVDCNKAKVKSKLSDFNNNTIEGFVNEMALQGCEIGGEVLDDFMSKYELFKTSDYMKNNKPDIYKLVMMIGDKIKENKANGRK